MLWHPKLNQLIAGTHSGEVVCLYDPSFSLRGALLVEGSTVSEASGSHEQKKKKVEMRFGNLTNAIYAPESNDDDLRDSRDEPKKRDNRPGIVDPYLFRPNSM